MVLYPRSGFGGKIFGLGSIRFNRESIDSRFQHNMDHMVAFMSIPSCGKIFSVICESKLSSENSGEGSVSNVYPLGVIRSFSGFLELFLFLLPCFEAVPDW